MKNEPNDFIKIIFDPEPKKHLFALLFYCGTGIFINFFAMQVFCMAVAYAAIMCIAFFIAIASFPFIKSKIIKGIAYFLLGTGVPISLYCIVFLADPYSGFTNYIYFTLEILLAGLGLMAYIPFYLLIQIFLYFRSAKTSGKLLVAAGAIIPFIALYVYLFNLKIYIGQVAEIAKTVHSKDEFYSKLPRNHYTERLLGLDWKYHTRLCYICDGWRPPLNDPFLIIGLWCEPLMAAHHKNEPTNKYMRASLSESIYYYKKLFPHQPLKVKCPCSYNSSGKEYLSVNMDSLQH